MSDPQEARAEGFLLVQIGFVDVKRSERCMTAEFIASGCLGNVSVFKKQLSKCAEDGH